jgi:2-keto-3-deoxy-L-rhamnonate aldolase RhmA
VRIPDLVPHWISQTLDLGAEGIMVPRVESRAAAELAVSRMKYPPLGQRGLATGVGHSDFVSSLDAQAFVDNANANTLLVIQIESARGVQQVNDIVSVPGIDAVMIGPMDLSLSLGYVGQLEHPVVEAAMGTIIDACNRHGVAGGMHMGNADLLRKWRDRGARFITCSGDLGFLEQGARAAIATLLDDNAKR